MSCLPDVGVVWREPDCATMKTLGDDLTFVCCAQAKLFSAMRQTKLIPDDAGWQSLKYSRCGRTDKGVSALSQVQKSFSMLASMSTIA